MIVINKFIAGTNFKLTRKITRKSGLKRYVSTDVNIGPTMADSGRYESFTSIQVVTQH